VKTKPTTLRVLDPKKRGGIREEAIEAANTDTTG
jgi:hypothetical protein